MNTTTSDDNLDISDDRETKTKKRVHVPLKHPEEILIIRNLNKIHAINEQQRYLEDQCRENPLELMSRIGWEFELEVLSYKEDKLLKRNKRLWKALGKKMPIHNLSPSISIQINRPAHVVKGYRIPAITQYLKKEQLNEIDKKLEDLYERKDAIYLAIQNSATNVASPEQKEELDEIIRLEASLVAHAEDLRMDDINMEAINAMDDKLKSIKPNEVKALEEIKSIRANNEPEREPEKEKVEPIQESKEEREQTHEPEEMTPNAELDEQEADISDDSPEMEAYNEIQDIRDSQDDDMDIDDDIDSDDDRDLDDSNDLDK